MKTTPIDQLFAKYLTPEQIRESERRVDEMQLEQLLNELRLRTGLSHEELAKKLGVEVPPQYYPPEEYEDAKLGLLASIVPALGGRLRVTVELPGGSVEMSFGDEAQESPQKAMAAKKTSAA